MRGTRFPGSHWSAAGLTLTVGLTLTLAVLLAAGWVAASPVAIITVLSAGLYHWLGGTQTDLGALLSRRADERQMAVRTQARAFATLAVLAFCAITGVTAALLHRTAWPYAMVAGIGAVGFVIGLWIEQRFGRIDGSGSGGQGWRIGRRVRLDERQAAIVIQAWQQSGIVMFIVAIVVGLILSGRPGEVPFRLTALAFATALVAGFVIYRPARSPGR